MRAPSPSAYDFSATYRELEKIYRKRDDTGAAPRARPRRPGGACVERDGDLDAAEKALPRGARARRRSDFTVLSALVELHVNMRRFGTPRTRSCAIDSAFLESGKPPPPREVRVPALLRLAEIHATARWTPHRAATVLREVLRIEPAHQEALLPPRAGALRPRPLRRGAAGTSSR